MRLWSQTRGGPTGGLKGRPKLGLILWHLSVWTQEINFSTPHLKLFSVALPTLWNHCFHFGISLGAAPSVSQMSEVKHVISEVERRLPLCSITWYLLWRRVNKHRCTVCGWGCRRNAIVPWWVQSLPPQRMNSYSLRKMECWGQWKDSVLHPRVWEVISAGWQPFHPQLAFCKYSNCFVISKRQILFNWKYIWLTGDAQTQQRLVGSYFRPKLSQKQQETEGGW